MAQITFCHQQLTQNTPNLTSVIYRHVYTIQSGQGGTAIDHFGNIDRGKNGGSGVKCSLSLIISGGLSQT